jgi:hypothetical protein
MIKNASRRADNELSAAAESLQLGVVADTPVNHGYSNTRFPCQHFCFPGDLKREFTGRHKNQSLGSILLGVDFLQNGQDVGAGFAAAGSRLHHHVAAR